MERKILQDVVPPSRRAAVAPKKTAERTFSRERFPDTEPVSIKRLPRIEESEDEDGADILPPSSRKKTKKSSHSRFILWFVIIASVVVLFFAISLVYASATVKITPKTQSVSIEGTYTAKKDAKTDELQYELMTIVKQGNETVPATPSAQVGTKAKGRIILYNNYSPTGQKLLANTRLENSKGLIYTLDNAVIIPGMKKIGTKTTPGSIEVGITAQEEGGVYNSKITDLTGDFKIVGFKGDKKYDLFYGRMKSDITGGFTGINKIVDPAVAIETRNRIHDTLKKQLIAEADAQVPQGFIMYDNAYIITYQTLDNSPVEGNQVIMNERATFTGILFKRDSLTHYIAAKEIQKFKGNIEPLGIENLEFTLANKADFSASQSAPLVFSLKGIFKLVGTYPTAELTRSLAGEPVKDISTVLSTYGTITSADVVIRPFWKRSFPNKPERITIESTVK